MRLDRAGPRRRPGDSRRVARGRSVLLVALLAAALLDRLGFAAEPAAPGPWRAADAAGAPDWLRFGLEHRVRYESLDDDFRAAATGDASGFVLRTLVSAEATTALLTGRVELIDARAEATTRTRLDATSVDAVDVLQAHVELRPHGIFRDGDALTAKLGRTTIDLGSRRLVARNDFRNTINAFTGADVAYASAGGHLVRGFAVVPLLRLPTDARELARNELELDEENLESFLWGTFYGSPPLVAGIRGEAYLLGLHERDDAEFPSANRCLYTPGVRLFRSSAPGDVDFQLEAVGQLGESRAGTDPDDRRDLDHRASFVHVSVGYRFDAPWTPRLALQYDRASGDGDPDDDENGRFDTLFGARRFDFGPTGFFGVIARGNVSTPGVRLEAQPHATLDAFFAHRPFWLASKRDAWTAAGVRDPEGRSGRFVGHLLEARLRWQAVPKNVAVELGGAYFLRGRFAEEAGERDDAALYGYAALTLTI